MSAHEDEDSIASIISSELLATTSAWLVKRRQARMCAEEMRDANLHYDSFSRFLRDSIKNEWLDFLLADFMQLVFLRTYILEMPDRANASLNRAADAIYFSV